MITYICSSFYYHQVTPALLDRFILRHFGLPSAELPPSDIEAALALLIDERSRIIRPRSRPIRFDFTGNLISETE